MGGKVALALLEHTRSRGPQSAAAADAPSSPSTAAAAAAAASAASGSAAGAGPAGGRVAGLSSGGPRDATPRSSAFAPFSTTSASAAAAAASPSAAAAAAAAATTAAAAHRRHGQDEGPTCAPPRQLWVLDSQPGLVAAEQDAGTGVSRVLQTVHVSAGALQSGWMRVDAPVMLHPQSMLMMTGCFCHSRHAVPPCS